MRLGRFFLSGLGLFLDARQYAMLRPAFAYFDEPLVVGQLVQYVQHKRDVVELIVHFVLRRLANLAQPEKILGKHVYIGYERHVQIDFLRLFGWFRPGGRLFLGRGTIGFGLIGFFFGLLVWRRLFGLDFALDFRRQDIFGDGGNKAAIFVQSSR